MDAANRAAVAAASTVSHIGAGLPAPLDQNVAACAAAATPEQLLPAVRILAASLRIPVGNRHTSVNIEGWIAALDPGHLRESLHALFTSVDGDVNRFKAAVEGWFNDTMDRVSGWYKSFAQKWMIVIALGLAAVFNVDTLRVVRELYNNPNLAKAVAAQAATYAKDATMPKADKELSDTAGENLQSAIADLRDSRLPIGWDDARQRRKLGLDRINIPALDGSFCGWLRYLWNYTAGYGKCVFDHFSDFLFIFGGWLLTAVAASFGAPFWFDLLGKIINIRSAGKAPERKAS